MQEFGTVYKTYWYSLTICIVLIEKSDPRVES